LEQEKRTRQMHFRLTPSEYTRVEKKMSELGVRSLGAYLRKMALDGICVKLDVEEIRQITRLLSKTSANLNQYARKANATGSIYKEDIQDLQKSLDEIWELHRQLLVRLAALS